MTHTRIHPKSLPITQGWSQIGPRPRHFKAIPKKDLSEAFRFTLNRQESRRIRKLRHKIAQGALTETEAILGVIDNLLAVRPPKVYLTERERLALQNKKVVANVAA